MDKKTIFLYGLGQPAIIVKAETGLIYTNQTAGVCCNHPSQEGFLIVLGSVRGRTFDPTRWYDEMPGMNDQTYDEIEQVLNGRYSFHWGVQGIKIDRAAKNEEAWIHVNFRGDFESGTFRPDINEEPEFDKYPLYEGILTWENCD